MEPLRYERLDYLPEPKLPYMDSKFIPSGENIPRLTSKKKKKHRR